MCASQHLCFVALLSLVYHLLKVPDHQHLLESFISLDELCDFKINLFYFKRLQRVLIPQTKVLSCSSLSEVVANFSECQNRTELFPICWLLPHKEIEILLLLLFENRVQSIAYNSASMVFLRPTEIVKFISDFCFISLHNLVVLSLQPPYIIHDVLSFSLQSVKV